MVQQTAEGAVLPCSIAAWLSVRRSAQAVEFYRAAFGAAVVDFVDGGEGGVVARLSVQGAEFWMSEESVEHANFSPESLAETVVEQALSAGASLVHAVGDGHGWRIGRIVDPFGHHWEIGRPLTVSS